MSRASFRAIAILLVGLVSLAPEIPTAVGQSGSTDQVDGLRRNRPDCFALTGVRIVVAPGQVIAEGTVVVRRGKFAAVGAEVRPPHDARAIDMQGRAIYPGLIDGFSEQSLSADAVEAGAVYWNAMVRPQARLAAQYKPDTKLNATLRQQGIAARLVAPSGNVIKGASALVLTGDDPPARAILNGDVAQHIRLTVARQRDSRDYPNSPMGAVALARQALYDAGWYRQAWRAVEVDSSLPLPERNDALQALQGYLDGGGRVVVDTSNELFFLRADRLAREFGLDLIVRGSGNEYRRLADIKRADRPVIVPVNFPDPPNVATAEAALGVSLESLMHWDLAPENPGRVDAAGIKLALCSHGLSDPAKFLDAIRKAVKHGLSAESALRALTSTPAELFGCADQLGTIEVGKIASFVVTDGDLFAADSKVLETWVAGRRYAIESQPLRPAAGDWSFNFPARAGKPRRLLVAISKTPKLEATIRPDKTLKGFEGSVKLSRVEMAGTRLSGTFAADSFGQPGVARFTVILEEDPQAAALGYVTWPDGTRAAMTAHRLPPAPAKEADSGAATEPEQDNTSDPADRPRASFAVNYPLGAYGRTAAPEQHKSVLFRGATVWTCGPQGILKNASVLIGAGQILAVGKKMQAPTGTLVVEGQGLHLTPGIIDCHSHMATDGGVNESGQAITAEVRIGDFIDCDDINIYRQLAGGVTSSNILHGSANPIGGQNQVIKLRWGALDEELKFAEAPAGIKFALGENVKQSNWGDDYTTRYPQTRMGVEQIFRDEFQAAREYRRRWDAWRTA